MTRVSGEDMDDVSLELGRSWRGFGGGLLIFLSMSLFFFFLLFVCRFSVKLRKVAGICGRIGVLYMSIIRHVFAMTGKTRMCKYSISIFHFCS